MRCPVIKEYFPVLYKGIGEGKGVAILEPGGALLQHDFESAAKLVDRYIEAIIWYYLMGLASLRG